MKNVTLQGKVIEISSGLYHSLALTDKGEVIGWGLNSFGQIGDLSKTDKLS
jgi:alpha-tubulin suppressor-like RCC1 family protein